MEVEDIDFKNVILGVIQEILEKQTAVALDQLIRVYGRMVGHDFFDRTNDYTYIRRKIYSLIRKLSIESKTLWFAHRSSPAFRAEIERVLYYEPERLNELKDDTYYYYIALGYESEEMDRIAAEYPQFTSFVLELRRQGIPFLLCLNRKDGEYSFPTYSQFLEWELKNTQSHIKAINTVLREFTNSEIPLPPPQREAYTGLENSAKRARFSLPKPNKI